MLINDPLIKELNKYYESKSDLNIEQMIPGLKTIISDNIKDTISNILAELFEQSKKDAFYTFPISGQTNEFTHKSVLYSDHNYDLSISIINKHELDNYKEHSHQNIEQRGIGFYGKHQFSYFLNSGSLKANIWEYPLASSRLDELDLSNLMCKKVKMETFKDDDSIYLAPNQTMIYKESLKNTTMVSIDFKQDTYPLDLMFSAKSRKLKHQNPTHAEATRIQFYCNLLKKMDYQDAIPSLKKLLSHDLYFIRWTAMQELLGLDAYSVLQELNEMSLKDKHPEVRSAAAETLVMIDNIEATHAH